MLFFAIVLGIAIAGPLIGLPYKGMASEVERQNMQEIIQSKQRR